MTAKSVKTASSIALITSAKALNAEIERIRIVGASYQVDLHTLACSVLAHVGKHGNIGIVTQFLGAVPDAVRLNAIKDWFQAFSKVSFVDANGKPMKTPAYQSDKPQRLGEAMEKPFWKFKANEGGAYVPLVLDTYIDQQIRKLKKDMENVPVTDAEHDPRPVLLAAMQKAKLAQVPATVQ